MDLVNSVRAKESVRSDMDRYMRNTYNIRNHTNGPVKGILMDTSIPKQRRDSKNKKRSVAFANIPEFNAADEEAKIISNRKKYKKDKDGSTIGICLKKVQKPYARIQIKPNDPILTTPYNKYILSDQVEKKKFVTELEVCRIHINN